MKNAVKTVKNNEKNVQEQVILPWPVAIRITLRGLKIRLGRSLITMSGVVLGIAFLMSVFTGESLRQGLAHETRTKTEVNRLLKLVEDEIGSFTNREIAILITDEVNDEHRGRLLQRMGAKADAGSLRIFYSKQDAFTHSDSRKELPVVCKGPAFRLVDNVEELFAGAQLVILFDEKLPNIEDEQLKRLLNIMRQPVVLDYHHGRYTESQLRALNPASLYTSLSYAKSEEEIAQEEKRAYQAKARQIWITVVSMLVTVIGISNAMLMSVTERFREIGTMKCLGALSGFVVKLFLIESLIIGAIGSVVGTLLGFVVPFIAYLFTTGIGLLFASTPFATLFVSGLESISIGTVLSIVAAIYPARVAAKMVPADALRTNV